MNIDSFMTIGGSHYICEDYIRHGVDPVPYVILSDGCSSSKDTDIGARLMVTKAHEMLVYLATGYDHFRFNKFPRYYIKRAIDFFLVQKLQRTCELLNVPQTVLDTTLILAFKLLDKIHVVIHGDGNIVWVQENNNIFIENYSYEQNMPYYLSYKLNAKNMDHYLNLQNNKLKKKLMKNNDVQIESVCGEGYGISTFNMEDLKSLFITSDGIETFDVPLFDTVKEFMSFKNTKGEFLKRRSKRAVKILGNHYDDISIGGFIF